MKYGQKNNIKPSEYFSNAMLVFLALGLDTLVVIGIKGLLPVDVWYRHIICSAVTVAIWTIAVLLTYKYIRKNNFKNIFSLNTNKKVAVWFIVFFALLALINIMIKGKNIPQFIAEFNVLKYKYGEYGIYTYVVQNIYYMLEAMLITLIIVFGQRWGKLKFNGSTIPYGGIVLSLSWGLVHILVQDIRTGIFTVIVSLIVGAAFLVCKKNLVLTYILALAIFLI